MYVDMSIEAEGLSELRRKVASIPRANWRNKARPLLADVLREGVTTGQHVIRGNDLVYTGGILSNFGYIISENNQAMTGTLVNRQDYQWKIRQGIDGATSASKGKITLWVMGRLGVSDRKEAAGIAGRIVRKWQRDPGSWGVSLLNKPPKGQRRFDFAGPIWEDMQPRIREIEQQLPKAIIDSWGF